MTKRVTYVLQVTVSYEVKGSLPTGGSVEDAVKDALETLGTDLNEYHGEDEWKNLDNVEIENAELILMKEETK